MHQNCKTPRTRLSCTFNAVVIVCIKTALKLRGGYEKSITDYEKHRNFWSGRLQKTPNRLRKTPFSLYHDAVLMHCILTASKLHSTTKISKLAMKNTVIFLVRAATKNTKPAMKNTIFGVPLCVRVVTCGYKKSKPGYKKSMQPFLHIKCRNNALQFHNYAQNRSRNMVRVTPNDEAWCGLRFSFAKYRQSHKYS